MKLKKLQMGGEPMPQEQPAPQEGGGGEDPVMQLVEMAVQALQTKDPNMMAAVCEGLVALVQGAQGGGAPQEEPVMMRKGGSIKVCKKGKQMVSKKKC